MTNLFRLVWFNIRMRIADWCNKPEVIVMSGYDWVEKVGKL